MSQVLKGYCMKKLLWGYYLSYFMHHDIVGSVNCRPWGAPQLRGEHEEVLHGASPRSRGDPLHSRWSRWVTLQTILTSVVNMVLRISYSLPTIYISLSPTYLLSWTMLEHRNAGYEDVRDYDGQWIRIEIKKGDLIVLPPGMYHRFTLDKNQYLKVIPFSIYYDEICWASLAVMHKPTASMIWRCLLILVARVARRRFCYTKGPLPASSSRRTPRPISWKCGKLPDRRLLSKFIRHLPSHFIGIYPNPCTVVSY